MNGLTPPPIPPKGKQSAVKREGFFCHDCGKFHHERPYHRLARLTPREFGTEPLCRTCWTIYQGLTGDKP